MPPILETRLELGLRSGIEYHGQRIWIVDAHRDDGRRFVARADEKLTAFVELESAIDVCGKLISQAHAIFSKLTVAKTDFESA